MIVNKPNGICLTREVLVLLIASWIFGFRIDKKDILNGVNVISGKAFTNKGLQVEFIAVPFNTLNNRRPGNTFKVWAPVHE